jgi:uncharacterized Rmd1/YagE family protein
MVDSGLDLFHGDTGVRVRALYLGERLDVRALEQTNRLALSPLVIRAGERGAAALFRYGAVVLFHVQPLEEAGLLEQLKRFVGDPFQKVESEDVEIRLGTNESVEAGVITVTEFTVERLQVIAEILAKSIVLARSESAVRESTTAIEAWAAALERTGGGGSLAKKLRKHLGATLLIQNTLAGRIEIGDKPDVLWDRPDLERLYARIEDEYELKERDRALERKLGLMTSTAETLLTLVNNKHTNRLEWYIIALFAFEIALTLFTMATK